MANPKMWLKRVLIPLWTIQLIVLAVFFVLACIVLSYASATSDSSYYYDYSDAYAYVASHDPPISQDPNPLTLPLTALPAVSSSPSRASASSSRSSKSASSLPAASAPSSNSSPLASRR